jgi:hypothetical protein
MSKVLGIGLGKTGTKSLVEALKILGYNAVHCLPLEAGVLDSVDAAADTPIATQFELLDQLYPGSRFICTMREIESWLASCRSHFTRPHNRGVDNLYRLKMFGTLVFDEARFRSAYERHHQRVEAYFSGRPQDLLYLNIAEGEGWQRLCAFLEKPPPTLPFPYKNRRGEEISYAV